VVAGAKKLFTEPELAVVTLEVSKMWVCIRLTLTTENLLLHA